MSDDDMDEKPAGFEKIRRTVRGESLDSQSCRIEIFLPLHLVDHLNDEERILDEAKRKVAREGRERQPSRYEMADRASEEKAAAAPALTAAPVPAQSAPPKAFVPGIDFDPQLEHLTYATTEPDAVVLRTKLTPDEGLRVRDLEIVDRLKAKGPLRRIINPFQSDPSLAPFDRLAARHPHFAAVIDMFTPSPIPRPTRRAWICRRTTSRCWGRRRWPSRPGCRRAGSRRGQSSGAFARTGTWARRSPRLPCGPS